MISFFPEKKFFFNCLRCNSLSDRLDVTFLGADAIATCYCSSCNQNFYHTLPLGHSIYFPIAFDDSGNKIYDERAKEWLAEPLISSFLNKEKVRGIIEKKVLFETKKAIILNCLDSCFGHILTKLSSSQHYLENDKDYGVIIIIPKACDFFVPDGLAEVWSVDLPISSMKGWIEGFDSFIAKEFRRFQEIYLALGYMHVNYSEADFSILTRVKKKELAEFDKLPLQITFCLREDRIWVSNRLEATIELISSKFPFLRWLRHSLIFKQNRKINRVAKLIKKQFKDVKFAAVGVGKRDGLDKTIKDLRVEQLDEYIQKEWWQVFSNTHITIGMHGSAMLIPTSLSMGFIDLLPRYKIRNYSDDISISHLTPNVLFFSRIMDIYSSADLVASHSIGMLLNFQLWNKEIYIKPKLWDSAEDIYRSFR